MPELPTDDQALTITHAGQQYQVPIQDDFVFGRAGDLVIDSDNRSLHRYLGRLMHSLGMWQLHNCGQTISLIITDEDSPSYASLSPGCSMPLPYENATITFSAGHASYRLSICHKIYQEFRSTDHMSSQLKRVDTRTLSLERLHFNDEQLAVLRLLAQSRLRGPITASDLPTNQDLATSLGWSLPKLVRKLDHLCAKLDRAGVDGLVPSDDKPAQQRRVVLANTVVESGIIR